MYYKNYTTLARLFFLLLALQLGGCSEPADEQALQRTIDSIVEGIEEKKSDQVLDQLSEQFQNQHGQDRAWAQKLLALNFLRHNRVGVTLVQQHTVIDPLYPDRANTSGQVLLTGSDRWLPREGRLYTVTAQWRQEDNEWRLYRLGWE